MATWRLGIPPSRFISLWEVLEPIEPLSVLYYFDPGQALVNGRDDASNLVVLGLVGVVRSHAELKHSSDRQAAKP